ncbi:hypothetical protein WIS52_16035 [Pseudonocardia nematodicida]|uniref:Uncharacterized protein n=1 Tax=Pseudonocardia nematodicida TaxID=1206997 RepID=A0ABV1KDM2_9PSEU
MPAQLAHRDSGATGGQAFGCRAVRGDGRLGADERVPVGTGAGLVGPAGTEQPEGGHRTGPRPPTAGGPASPWWTTSTIVSPAS